MVHQKEPEATAEVGDKDQTMADLSEAQESDRDDVERDVPDHNTQPKPKGRGRPAKSDSQLLKKIQKL